MSPTGGFSFIYISAILIFIMTTLSAGISYMYTSYGGFMDNSTAIDQAFDVVDIMARIRQNVNMAKAGKITQARVLERIEELLGPVRTGRNLLG